MRAICLAVLVLVIGSGVASQVPPFVGLSTSEQSWECSLDPDTGLVDVFVRIEGWDGLTEVSFRIDNNTTLIRLGEECPVGATCIGDPETGITVSMPCADATGGLVLLKVTYAGSGDSPPCSRFRIEPPGGTTGSVQFVDCDSGTIGADGGWLLVKPDGTPGCTDCDMSIPVENTTWGRVKALFD